MTRPRAGPRGWTDNPVPFEGLYLGGAGCHGGPGVTFIPGYNAGYAVLDARRQPKKVLRVADARIDTAKGELICSTVDTATLDPGNGMVAAGIFHNYDYPFYYFDIRANAANRIKRYLARR